MKNQPVENPVTIEDIFLASAVVVLAKTDPEVVVCGPGRAAFNFPPTPEVFQALGGYPSRATGVLFDYAAAYRTLRRLMYQKIDGRPDVRTYHAGNDRA